MKKQLAAGFIALLLVLPGQVKAVEGPVEKWKAKNTEKLETMCQKELETYCRTVTPGNKRGLACLYAHSDKLSSACESAFYDASEELRNATENLNTFVSACREDMEKLCSKVAVGEGRVLTCLEKNKEKVSANCNEVRQKIGEEDLGKKKSPDFQYPAVDIH